MRTDTAAPAQIEACPLCQFRGDRASLHRHLQVAHRKRRIARAILERDSDANGS